MDDNKRIKRNILIAAGAAAAFLLVVLAFALPYLGGKHKRGDEIDSSGNPKTAQNATGSANAAQSSSCGAGTTPQAMQDAIQGAIYPNVRLANDYNAKPTAAQYAMSIRDGSCQQSDSGRGTSTANAIIDVPDAGQSWQLRFSWIDEGSKLVGNAGDPQVSCLPASQLKYGDFNCQNVLNTADVANCGAVFANGQTTPGFQNLGAVTNGDSLALDSDSIIFAESKLTTAIAARNAGQPHDSQIACVFAIATDSAQSGDTTSWQAKFLTWRGDETTHTMKLSPGAYSGQIFSLDGRLI